MTAGLPTPTRSKSQTFDKLESRNFNKNIEKTTKNTIDVHKFSQIGFNFSDETYNLEYFRKNRATNESELFAISRSKSKTPIKSPKEICPDCYNYRLLEQKEQEKSQKIEKTRTEAKNSPVSKNCEICENDQQIEKKIIEQKILKNDEILIEKSPKKNISHKITDSNIIKNEPDVYKYEGYGTDHQKNVEHSKEQQREKLRKTAAEKITENSKKHEESRTKIMGLNTENGGNLALPSYCKKPYNKSEYRKTLLDQMEIEHKKRVQNREERMTKIDEKIKNDISKGEYVDFYEEKRKNLRQEYMESMKIIEKKKLESKLKKQEDSKIMQAAVNEYKEIVNQLHNLKKVNFSYIIQNRILNKN